MIRCSEYDTDLRQIKVKLDTGGEVMLDMYKDYFAYYGPGCDLELDFTDDSAKDIIFRIGGEHYTVLQIIQWALAEWVDIDDDIRQEEADAEVYAYELRSPYMTGRI